jgi:hypothetical protein
MIFLALFVVCDAAFNITALRRVLFDLGCFDDKCDLWNFVVNESSTCPLTRQQYDNGEIACNAAGEVVHLDLSESHLSGSVTSSIQLLSALTYLCTY